MPPEVEWFTNIANRHTRRAYDTAVKDFMRFVGICRPEESRIVTRAHIIAWRDELAHRGLGGSSIRRRLASLAEYLCNKNALTHSPAKGVERPKSKAAKAKRRRSPIIRRAGTDTGTLARSRSAAMMANDNDLVCSPPNIIRHAVWLYLRFTLSFRDVEDLLAERGLDLSYETVGDGC